MKYSHVLMGFIAVMLALTALSCGCTDTGTTTPATATATPMATTVVTPEETAVPVEPEWMLWREGAGQTLNRLGDYQVFTPNVNKEEFRELKIEVTSSEPITVMFFNKTELKNFENKMSTNQGDFTPISTYENVRSDSIEESSEDYLSIVLQNPGSSSATVTRANIWYKV